MKTENVRINCIIDKKTLDALKDYCYKTQLSASAVIRLALGAYLEKKAKGIPDAIWVTKTEE